MVRLFCAVGLLGCGTDFYGMGLLVALVGLRMGWECWGARLLSVGFLALGFMGVGNSGGWDFWLRWWDSGGVGILRAWG